jgi:cytochrome b561
MARFLNSAAAYGIIAQALHWCVAALILIQFPLGLYAADLPVSMARLQWLSYHKSLGLTILALVLVRLVWCRMDVPPPLPGTMARWERRAALAMHSLLYVIPVLAMLAGWLYASAAGLSVNWFGLILIPDLIAKNTGIAPLFKELHHGLAGLLALLLAGHMAAAARHAFILRDNVAQRMLPAGWRRR